MKIERGDVLLVGLDPTQGSEIRKTRPAIVVTNNVANNSHYMITVVPVTSQKLERIRVFEVLIDKTSGLAKPSKALITQMRSIDKSRVKSKLGKISPRNLESLDTVLKLHLSLK